MKNMSSVYSRFWVAALFGALLWSCGGGEQQKAAFVLSAQEVLELATTGAHRVAPAEVEHIIESNNPNYVLVDVRPVVDFERGHLETAINLPAQHLLEEENLSMLSNMDIEYILYGRDEREANGPWLLLRQLGLQNILVMTGGTEYFRAARDSTVTDLPALDDEAACCDYAALLDEARQRYQREMQLDEPFAEPAPAATPKKIVPKKKYVVEEEEGC